MRKDKQERLERFADLIAETIKAADPLTMKLCDGFAWAAMPQPAWCEKLKISDRTLRELAKCCPPIVSTKTVNEERKPIVLYRVGSEPHKSLRHLANVMAKLYRQKYGMERVSRHDWGCLIGLASVWPNGVQVDIFRSVLADFKAFMSVVKGIDPDCPHAIRYYKWLPIPLLRKYPDIALELYIATIQETGQVPHPAIVALNPKLWSNQSLIG
jgi:hypothetical protein